MIEKVKFRLGKFRFPVVLETEPNLDTIKLRFQYNKELIEEIKSMEGSKWHPESKCWTIKKGLHNQFRMSFLTENNPYARWDRPLIEWNPEWENDTDKQYPLFQHQLQSILHVITYHYFFLAEEMGCIDGETFVQTYNPRIFVKIKDLYNEQQKQNPFFVQGLLNYNGTKFQYNVIEKILYQGHRHTIQIITDTNKILNCTEDHEICVGGNTYLRADNLTVNSQILCDENGQPTLVKIKSIKYKGMKDVYDIVMYTDDDKEHNFVANGIVVHNCGKSREIIKAMEIAKKEFDCKSFLWVSSKGALVSTELELRKWNSSVNLHNGLQLLTYEGLVKLMKNWVSGSKPPQFVVFDEGHKVCNPTAQRSQAARHLGHAVITEWGDSGFAGIMTGTPAPRDPSNWFHPCSIVAPGFLKEGDAIKFKKRLAIIEQRESITGQSYPHLVSWKDDENKCQKCGKLKTDPCHTTEMQMFGDQFHDFIPSKNEVALLYRRLKGLVNIKFKKDVMKELPELIFERRYAKPTQSILNALKIIQSKSSSAIEALILSRELSDGFQYTVQELEGLFNVCPTCNGNRVINDWVYIGPVEQYNEETGEYQNELTTTIVKPDGSSKEIKAEGLTNEEFAKSLINNATQNYGEYPQWFTKETHKCPHCNGTGKVIRTERKAKYVHSPKIDLLEGIVEENEESGRLVVYAGFTGSIDNVIKNVEKWGWDWIRVDGRGWLTSLDPLAATRQRMRPVDMVEAFQDKEGKKSGFKDKKIVFVGHPSSAGEGLTLTAAHTFTYYSNDFNFGTRKQSLARGHRPGMDLNKGCTIIDLIHLPTDELVLNNLDKKEDLQNMTLGVLKEQINKLTEERET